MGGDERLAKGFARRFLAETDKERDLMPSGSVAPLVRRALDGARFRPEDFAATVANLRRSMDHPSVCGLAVSPMQKKGVGVFHAKRFLQLGIRFARVVDGQEHAVFDSDETGVAQVSDTIFARERAVTVHRRLTGALFGQHALARWFLRAPSADGGGFDYRPDVLRQRLGEAMDAAAMVQAVIVLFRGEELNDHTLPTFLPVPGGAFVGLSMADCPDPGGMGYDVVLDGNTKRTGVVGYGFDPGAVTALVITRTFLAEHQFSDRQRELARDFAAWRAEHEPELRRRPGIFGGVWSPEELGAEEKARLAELDKVLGGTFAEPSRWEVARSEPPPEPRGVCQAVPAR